MPLARWMHLTEHKAVLTALPTHQFLPGSKRDMTLRSSTSIATVILTALFSIETNTAQADHRSALYHAADHYRDAVCDFERHVIKLRYFSHEDRRLVDRLEDSTSGLRSAARHPERYERLFREWNEVSAYHQAVEAAIFHRGCYPYNPALAACWERVECAYREVATALRSCRHSVVPHHGHSGNSFGYETYRRPFPSTSFPHTTFPSATFPSSSFPNNSVHQPRRSFDDIDTRRDILHQRNSFEPTAPINQSIRTQPRSFERRDIGSALIGALLNRVLN